MDYYEVLGVDKLATTESQLKIAYHQLALKYHPDRNVDDHEAEEKMKKFAIAYATLSDPQKRRQYDLHRPSGADLNFDGVDVSEMNIAQRIIGAFASKLGAPLPPTQIGAQVLIQASDLCNKRAANAVATYLRPGQSIHGLVTTQKAHFLKIKIKPEDSDQLFVIECGSISMDKFKLVLFDREGGVRMIKNSVIEECNRRRRITFAEISFLPYSAYEHLICVYGDNWVVDVNYQLSLIPAKQLPLILQNDPTVQRIES